MWTSILINITISLSIILIGHYLWNYLLETYSDKVTKDIIGSQTQKYKVIIDELQRKTLYPEIEFCMTDTQEYPMILDTPSLEDSSLEDPSNQDLKNDLENFLQQTIDENK
jgi:hypothetical protein